MKFRDTLMAAGSLWIGATVATAAHSYVWDGGNGNTTWSATPNWDVGGIGNFPGNAAGDDATIANATQSNPVVLSSDLAQSLVSLTIDPAGPNTTNMGLRVSSAQTGGNGFGDVELIGNGSYEAYLDIEAAGVFADSLTVSGDSAVYLENNIVVDVGDVILEDVANTALTIHAVGGNPELRFDSMTNDGPRPLVLSAASGASLTLTQY